LKEEELDQAKTTLAKKECVTFLAARWSVALSTVS
jgi:hypothetical protein